MSKKTSRSLEHSKPKTTPTIAFLETHEPTSDKLFKPTTVVLAKVKGYPSWPAMVLDESILPQNILDKKPRNVKQISKKKNSKSIEILPVRFFSDDTYIWIKDNDLKILSKEMIQDYLGNDRRRKDDLLNEAYILANDPPKMELFVRYGSKVKPDEIEIVEVYGEYEFPIEDDSGEILGEDEEEDYEEPPKKKLKKSPKKSSSTNLNSASKKSAKNVIKNSRNGNKTTKYSKTSKQVKKSEPEQNIEEDSDWSLDELDYDYENGNYIFDDEKEQDDFIKNFPAAASVQEKFNKFQSQFKKINDELSTLLLVDDKINELEVLKNLNLLKELNNLPKSIILKSRLLKVLILIIRKPIENFPYKKIKEEVSSLLKSWFDLSVTANKLEDLEKLDDSLKNNDSKTQNQESGIIDIKNESLEPLNTNGNDS